MSGVVLAVLGWYLITHPDAHRQAYVFSPSRILKSTKCKGIVCSLNIDFAICNVTN